MLNSGLPDKYEQLRQHFLSGLPRREAEIEDHTATLLQFGADKTALNGLHMATHKLAGISGIYGLTRLEHLAQTAENLLENTQDGDVAQTEVDQILLAADLLSEELETLIAAA